MVSHEMNQMCSLVRARKKASQSLWMFNVKEEQNIISESWPKLVRILISEGSLSLLKILGTKSLAEMFTGDEREVEILRSFNWSPSELAT
ncbi:hypothetical protein Tco_0613887 [Tanacetum coccineum]